MWRRVLAGGSLLLVVVALLSACSKFDEIKGFETDVRLEVDGVGYVVVSKGGIGYMEFSMPLHTGPAYLPYVWEGLGSPKTAFAVRTTYLDEPHATGVTARLYRSGRLCRTTSKVVDGSIIVTCGRL